MWAVVGFSSLFLLDLQIQLHLDFKSGAEEIHISTVRPSLGSARVILILDRLLSNWTYSRSGSTSPTIGKEHDVNVHNT